MEKKLKIVLFILIIILIAIIAFIGVYSKDLVGYKNILPEYLKSSQITGKRVSYFTINTSTQEIIYDVEGNEVAEIPEGANEADYTKESKKVNLDESLNSENYKKVKNIFEGRLKELGVTEYTIRLNEETGNIVVELANDITTDDILSYLLYKGDFSMTDSEDGTILLEKSDLKNASVVYGNSETGEIEIYLSIKFTTDGAKKLHEISKTYFGEKKEDGSIDENQKMVTLTIESSDILTTYFAEEMSTGELTLLIGTAEDTASAYEYMNQAQLYAMLLNNDDLPVRYNVETSEYIANNISQNTIYIIIGTISGICVCIMLYMIFRFKLDGVLSSIAFISVIAMLLLLIRYTKTVLSYGGATAICLLIVFDVYLMIKVLKSIQKNNSYENVVNTTIKTYFNELDVIIIFLIVAVVFTFMPEIEIFSIGMTLFYGIISIIIANLLFMRSMLIARHALRKE